MRIGIIGSGRIGATAADLVVQAGHEVAIANSRGPDSLRDLVARIGPNARAATVEEARDFGDVVMLAVPMRAYADLPATGFTGKVVIDANNYAPQRDGQIAEIDSGQMSSGEVLDRRLDGARVVKAFNTMNFATLASEGKPEAPLADRLAIFVAGDDAEAKRVVSGLIDELGFAPIDTGSLGAGARLQERGAPLFNRPMRPAEAEDLLG